MPVVFICMQILINIPCGSKDMSILLTTDGQTDTCESCNEYQTRPHCTYLAIMLDSRGRIFNANQTKTLHLCCVTGYGLCAHAIDHDL